MPLRVFACIDGCSTCQTARALTRAVAFLRVRRRPIRTRPQWGIGTSGRGCYARTVPDRSGKRPRDVNELARQLVDEAVGDSPAYDPDAGKNAAAVALGRRGGLKGGKARAAALTAEQRSEAARKAARARWHVDRRSEPPSAAS